MWNDSLDCVDGGYSVLRRHLHSLGYLTSSVDSEVQSKSGLLIFYKLHTERGKSLLSRTPDHYIPGTKSNPTLSRTVLGLDVSNLFSEIQCNQRPDRLEVSNFSSKFKETYWLRPSDVFLPARLYQRKTPKLFFED